MEATIDEQTVSALQAQLFCRENATVFAILDGATVSGLPAILRSFEPEYYCLYRGALQPDMAEVAPYLARLEPNTPFIKWVLSNGWGKHWGIFGMAEVELRVLRTHFRRFVMVDGGRGKPLYFRYYDPGVLRNYLPMCDQDELRTVFGPAIFFLAEEVNPQAARMLALGENGLQQKTMRLDEIGSGAASAFAVSLAETHPTRGASESAFELVMTRERAKRLGDSIYAERMRNYLNEFFPESLAIPPEVMGQRILELTDRAADYKLILETHVAPFMVAAWIFGMKFDEEFLAVKKVLEDYDMDCEMKAQWLWSWVEEATEILDDGLPGE